MTPKLSTGTLKPYTRTSEVDTPRYPPYERRVLDPARQSQRPVALLKSEGPRPEDDCHHVLQKGHETARARCASPPIPLCPPTSLSLLPAVPYVQATKKESDGDMSSTLATTLPMAAVSPPPMNNTRNFLPQSAADRPSNRCSRGISASTAHERPTEFPTTSTDF